MTCTRSDRRPVFLEFPDFGYGPASTLLTLVSGIAGRFDWHIVSTGAAAQFARSQLPGAVVHDLDTFEPRNWPAFLGTVEPNYLVVSGTNPEFAAWAIEKGYRVGVVDTLDWMWPALPDAIEDAEFHLVQAYFGALATPSTSGVGGRRQAVRPIVDPGLWPADGVRTRTGTVLISFGGMRLPDGDDVVAAYARWFLGAVLPMLVDEAGATEITIAGGQAGLPELVPGRWRTHPSVRIRPGLDRVSYARLARAAEHLIVSPGLASIHECAASRLTPLWQPGFNMSMLLQCWHLLATGYPYVAAWPWLTETAAHIADLPETEGIRHVAERITATVREADPAGETVTRTLSRYLVRPRPGPTLDLSVDPRLPDGAALLAAHLGRLACAGRR